MAQADQRLKANRKLEGRPCRWCQKPLVFGEDAVVCGGCGGEYHAECWDRQGGCQAPICVNAPLKGVGEPEKKATDADLPEGKTRCPSCNAAISRETQICPRCKAIVTDDGLYHGPRVNAPGAVASLVWGIVGLLVCGVILGPLAIVKANEAKKKIASHPAYSGGGLATAGLVLGIIDLVGWAIVLLSRLASIGKS